MKNRFWLGISKLSINMPCFKCKQIQWYMYIFLHNKHNASRHYTYELNIFCLFSCSCDLWSRTDPTVWEDHLWQEDQREHHLLRLERDVHVSAAVRAVWQRERRVHCQRRMDQSTWMPRYRCLRATAAVIRSICWFNGKRVLNQLSHFNKHGDAERRWAENTHY